MHGSHYRTRTDPSPLDAIKGGDYSVSLNGEIAFAGVDNTQLEGIYEFQTNTLDFNIEETVAAAVPKAINDEALPLEKRVRIVSCSGSQLTALTNAVSATQRLSTSAASAASSGSSTKFSEYFHTTSATTRSNVAAHFRSFASEASSTTSGSSSYSCVDFLGVCTSNTIAYAQPATGRMASCPIFWQLRAVSSGCGQQSQASTVLHEFTHILAGTTDHAYGYAASTALSASRAYTNADKYVFTLFLLFVSSRDLTILQLRSVRRRHCQRMLNIGHKNLEKRKPMMEPERLSIIVTEEILWGIGRAMSQFHHVHIPLEWKVQ